MGKKKTGGIPAPLGKKPINMAKRTLQKRGIPEFVVNRSSEIGNKMKRSEVYGRYLKNKKAERKQAKLLEEKRREEAGEEPAPKGVSRTLENAREREVTWVKDDDEDGNLEIQADEADDEFAPYLDGRVVPKVLITTRPSPSKKVFYFIADLQKLIPNLHYYPRKTYTLKEICRFASNRDFTHLMVLSEKSKVCNGLTICHLRRHDGTGIQTGPTAFFKLTNVVTNEDIPHHGRPMDHDLETWVPELNLHGFGTRLGHRVGRLLGSLFPGVTKTQQLQGRQIITFHNQRDYIFVRQHRYIFNAIDAERERLRQKKMEGKNEDDPLPPARARLQELGPRFTIKMRWLQEGTFDSKHGEYEWYHKRKEMDTTRRRFHL